MCHIINTDVSLFWMRYRLCSDTFFIVFISTSGIYNIYIICVPMRNRNNEFILEFILHEIKMADFERRQFEFGLEFVR